MKKLKTLLLVSCTAFMASISVQAALTLNIDTANQVLFFTGSATGTLLVSENQTASWNDGTFTGGVIGTVSDPSIITTNISGDTPISANLYIYGDGLIFDLQTEGNFTEISGNSNYASYADLAPAAITALEGRIGTTMILGTGSGWGDIDVVAGTIPEPSTAAALVGAFALTFVGLRRCRKA